MKTYKPKNLGQVAKNISRRNFSQIYSGNHELEQKINDDVKKIVDKVFEELTSIFLAWAHNMPDEDIIVNIKKTWVKAFYENGINTMEKIKFGVVNARRHKSDFFPSSGTFISWCKPNPEDMGFPSTERAKRLCIAYRSKEKFNTSIGIVTRPLIVELCKHVDWWLIEAGTTPSDFRKGDAHFEKKYLELINSGYQEPKETLLPRIETQEITKPRMSEQQEIDRQKRGMSNIADFRKKLKLKSK